MSQSETQTNDIVLVVEDNSINQRVTLLQLDELGLEATAVSNGLEALDAVSKCNYSLILMDCQMPEMDGLQATREIRKRELVTGEHVTIIALTAHAMTSDRTECLAVGMDDYISKPVSLKRLAEVLKRWLKHPLKFDFENANLDSKNSETRVKPVELEVLFSVFGKELIADLLVDFVAEAEQQMVELRKAVLNEELPTVNFLIHDLKGTSATIYATKLTELSFAMEQYCRGKQVDWSEVSSYFEAVETALTNVRDYLAANGYNDSAQTSENLAS
jgi:two-component system, sensor histidine kinase and response regulator